MSGGGSVDVILDEAKIGRLMIAVWALCALVMLLDGYDLTVIGFLAPEMAKEFGFDKLSLGFVFSAGLGGVALGGFTGGWIGDRYGRKLTLALACLLLGLATLSMLLTVTVAQLATCRFAVGYGLGLAMAAAVAISAEFAPKRIRNRVVALVSACGSVGAIAPGILTATLVPTHGWRLLAITGGLSPVLLAIGVLLIMPESVKYLALRPERHAQLSALLKRLMPDIQSALTPQRLTGEGNRGASPARLFDNGLATFTLLIWMIFCLNAIALNLIVSWLPSVLQASNMNIQQAAQISSLFALAVLIGAVMVAALISWAGVLIIPAMFIIAVPFLLMFTGKDLSTFAIILAVMVPGASAGAIQVAGTTLVGTLYPTTARVTGIGWIIGMGRIGAMFGPLVGTAVLALRLPSQQMFAFASIPMVLGGICGIALAILCYRRFGGRQVDKSHSSQAIRQTTRFNLLKHVS